MLHEVSREKAPSPSEERTAPLHLKLLKSPVRKQDAIANPQEFLSRCEKNGVEFQGDPNLYIQRVGLWPENFRKTFGAFPDHCSQGTFGSKPIFIRCSSDSMLVVLDQTVNCDIFKDTRVRFKLHFDFEKNSLLIDRSFVRKIGSKDSQKRARGQGMGIGRRYFKNIVQLAELSGIHVIHAKTEEVGGYAHLQTGFVPSDWMELRDKLAGKLARIKSQLLKIDPAFLKEIEELQDILSHSENPQDAWKIADSKIPVPFSLFKHPDNKIITLGQHLYLDEEYGIAFFIDDPKVQERFEASTKDF